MCLGCFCILHIWLLPRPQKSTSLDCYCYIYRPYSAFPGLLYVSVLHHLVLSSSLVFPLTLLWLTFKSALHLLDLGKDSSTWSSSESQRQVVMESLISEVALLAILPILYNPVPCPVNNNKSLTYYYISRRTGLCRVRYVVPTARLVYIPAFASVFEAQRESFQAEDITIKKSASEQN